MRRSLAAALVVWVAWIGGAAVAAETAGPPRILALSPHAAELVYAAGAGDQLVGAVAHSDYPAPARALPRVGDSSRLDRERILSLAPDLAVAWSTGNREIDLQWLRSAGIDVYRSDPRRIDQIAHDLEAIGERAGSGPRARETAAALRRRLAGLRRRYGGLEPLPAFYVLWDRPLMTVGGETLISRVMALCGLRNVFGEVSQDSLSLSPESLVAVRPRVILVPLAGGDADAIWLSDAWPGERPVEIRVDPDLLHRPGPRLIEGAERLCESRATLARGHAAGSSSRPVRTPREAGDAGSSRPPR